MRPIKNRRRVKIEPAKMRLPFRTSHLKKTLKAMQAVGISPGRVEIDPDGKIVVIASGAEAGVPNDALDRWMARHARSA